MAQVKDIFFNKGVPKGTTYPLTQRQIDSWPKGTQAVSPYAMTHKWVHLQAKDMPFEPFTTSQEEFWTQLIEVAEGVQMARSRRWKPFVNVPYMEDTPTSGCIIKDYKVHRPDQAAELVHADWPDEIVNHLCEFLIGKEAKWRNITNEGNYGNFTNGPVFINRVIGWAIHHVSPTCFAHKWYYGVPRPEEVIGAFVRGEIHSPNEEQNKKLRKIIKGSWTRDILRDQRLFTMYKGNTPGSIGSPKHPSFGAMHSAMAAVTLILPVFFDLTPEELYEVRQTTVNTSWYRLLAGVHYRMDNMYGIELGERVVEKVLPSYLAKYGADKRKVQRIISSHRNVNWLQYAS